MLMVYYLYGLLEVVCVPTTRHKASTAHCGCLIALQQISVRTREATAQQAFAYSIFTHIFCLFSNAINALPQAPSGLGFILDFYTYIKRPKIRQILSQFFFCNLDTVKGMVINLLNMSMQYRTCVINKYCLQCKIMVQLPLVEYVLNALLNCSDLTSLIH